jgi:hypothetical protein
MSNDLYEGQKKKTGKKTGAAKSYWNIPKAKGKTGKALHERSSGSQLKAQRADAAKKYPDDIEGAKTGKPFGRAKMKIDNSSGKAKLKGDIKAGSKADPSLKKAYDKYK